MIEETEDETQGGLHAQQQHVLVKRDVMIASLTRRITEIGKWYYEGKGHLEVAKLLKLTPYQYRELRKMASTNEDMATFCEYMEYMRNQGDVDALRKKGRGYEYTEERMNAQGEVVESYNKHMAPDVSALKFILKNRGRQADQWSEHDNHELAKIDAEVESIKSHIGVSDDTDPIEVHIVNMDKEPEDEDEDEDEDECN